MLSDLFHTCTCLLPEDEPDFQAVQTRLAGDVSVALQPMCWKDLHPIFALTCGEWRATLPDSFADVYLVPLEADTPRRIDRLRKPLNPAHDDPEVFRREVMRGAVLIRTIPLRSTVGGDLLPSCPPDKGNISYLEYAFPDGHHAHLLLFPITPRACFEICALCEIRPDILINSDHGFFTDFSSSELYATLCRTEKPHLLPRLYFEGIGVRDADSLPTLRRVADISRTVVEPWGIPLDRSTIWEIDWEKCRAVFAELTGTVHPLGSFPTYKYVVVCTFFEGKLILSRHRERTTWETQGGHIEPNETPLEAARRELYEESGITDAELLPICDYRGYRGARFANGVFFVAFARSLGELPASEIAETRAFDALPSTEQLTYPLMTPLLFEEAQKAAKPRTGGTS